MANKGAVPDAWDDDDWEVQADKEEKNPAQTEPALPQAPLTKAQRMAQHVEMNRKLWESAESPEINHFAEATSNVPLAANFKPQVKVLSRKPPPTQTIARRDPVSGAMSRMTINDDDDEDDERKKKQAQETPEEIRARQQREREEKQRRYDEARAKIFGESNPSSGASSPGATTPPRSDARGGGYQNHRGRGRGRGRGGGGGGPSRQQQYQQQQQQQQYHHQQQQAQVQPDNIRRPATQSETRGLYDPNASSPKPAYGQNQRRGGGGGGGNGESSAPGSGRASPRELSENNQPRAAIRAPRGPDGSGRGGFGFAKRGGLQEG